ncbi:MAG: class I SAM-dependent methyltransferase [Pseudomonadales bacterium]|nr:class I SAM-dependent methyltransferase [Pseudomonadales bacterium]
MDSYNNQHLYNNSAEGLKWKSRAKSPLIRQEQDIINLLDNKAASLIELGTGAGRIAYHLHLAGHTDITAVDYSDNLIECARDVHADTPIEFIKGDITTDLPGLNKKYDNIVALQQVLCFLSPADIKTALADIHNLLNTGGILIGSVLNFNSRYLINKFLQTITPQESNSIATIPWMKIGSDFNWKMLSAMTPKNIWFFEQQLLSLLKEAGFKDVKFFNRLDETNDDDECKHLYFMANKPEI